MLFRSRMTFGSGGIGNNLHLAGELFNMRTGTRLTHVPYKGGAPAVNALIAGEIQSLFVPPTPTPELYYAACDGFVFPSRYEAFSLVTLEAAAAGLPIIAHAINGTDELVTPEENGWLVPFGPEALREKVLRLRDDHVLCQRMSAAATASAARYDWDRIADEQFAVDRKSTRLNSSHSQQSRMPSSA